MSIPTASEFVQNFLNKQEKNNVRLATVDPDYVSGRPSLIFDGETTATVKKYAHLESYAPAANDRVLLVENVIIGKIV